MELFSEIYSCYYTVTSKILRSAPLTEKQMLSIINAHAFSDSALYLLPRLCKEDGWLLLEKQEKNYCSKLYHLPSLPVTTLEKRWLKSLLLDDRIRLFLEDATLQELSDKLSDIKPLYSKKDFKWFDTFSDGDNYSDSNYIINFKSILSAITGKSIIKVEFVSGKGKYNTGEYLPYRMEYSQKNDKFRVYVAKMKNMRTVSLGTINVSRIQHITALDQSFPGGVDMERIFKWRRCLEPVTIEISRERNGVERFMMEFAGYEKRTEIDEVSGKCIATLWYNLQDETEILIRLLSYGPILKLTGPARMLDQMKERIDKQYQLLNQEDKS